MSRRSGSGWASIAVEPASFKWETFVSQNFRKSFDRTKKLKGGQMEIASFGKTEEDHIRTLFDEAMNWGGVTKLPDEELDPGHPVADSGDLFEALTDASSLVPGIVEQRDRRATVFCLDGR